MNSIRKDPAPRTRLGIRRAGLLIATAASVFLGAPLAALDFDLAVEPPRPEEGEPFVIAIGGKGSCPVPGGVRIVHGSSGGTYELEILDPCDGPATDFLLEVPVDSLGKGTWRIDVLRNSTLAGRKEVTVEPLRFGLTVDPPSPTAGDYPISLRFRGTAACARLEPARVSGFLISTTFDEECQILPPPPSAFDVELELPNLVPGSYRAQVENRAGETLATVPFTLLPAGACVPDSPDGFSTTLCLRGGRFKVTSRFSTGGEFQDAYGVVHTTESGAFFFFSETNLELNIKILDTCGSERPRFWVFVAGLTNVAVTVTVTDTVTGEVWHRESPFGTVFQPILDTDALPCEAGTP